MNLKKINKKTKKKTNWEHSMKIKLKKKNETNVHLTEVEIIVMKR